MLDDIDRRLLRQMQADPSLTAADLAARAGVSPLKAQRRLGRLQERGILKGQHAVIDWRALGYGVTVSLRITLDKTQARAFDEFIAAARGIAEVTEIQTFLGRVDLRLLRREAEADRVQHRLLRLRFVVTVARGRHRRSACAHG